MLTKAHAEDDVLFKNYFREYRVVLQFCKSSILPTPRTKKRKGGASMRDYILSQLPVDRLYNLLMDSKRHKSSM